MSRAKPRTVESPSQILTELMVITCVLQFRASIVMRSKERTSKINMSFHRYNIIKFDIKVTKYLSANIINS